VIQAREIGRWGESREGGVNEPGLTQTRPILNPSVVTNKEVQLQSGSESKCSINM
jgi:hypothetical protein